MFYQVQSIQQVLQRKKDNHTLILFAGVVFSELEKI